MKRTIVAMFALLTCAVAFGEGYADWYTPATKFSEQYYAVAFMVGKKTGAIAKPLNANRATIRVALDSAVEKMELSASAKNAFALAKEALVEAIYAEFLAEQSKQKIDSLGASVETIFQLTNADKVDSSGAVISSGKLADGVRVKMLAKKNALIGGGGTGGAGAEGGEDQPLQITVTDFHYDNREFEQIQMNGNKSKMGLKGFKDLRTATAENNLDGSDNFALAQSGYHIPVSTKGDGDDAKLQWYKWNGWNINCFSAGDDTGGSNDDSLRLRNWNGGNGGCTLTLKGLLTNKDDPDYQAARNSHTIMTRCNDNGTYKLHYMSVGGLIDSLTAIEPDEVSIETHINDDGTTNLCVYGFNEANKAVAKGEKKIGLIPCANGGDKLAWAGLSEFFSDKVFNTTESGKIILNGVSEEGSDKVRVLAVKGSGDGQEVGTVAFDNASVDGNIETAQVVQMHNFSTAPSPYGGYSTFNFADALTNNSATISGMSIPVRYPNGNRVEIGYIPMGKVTGIPSASCDNKTIEASKDNDAADNEPDKLRIVGSKDATKGQLLKMGDNGKVEWGDFPIDVDRPEGLAQDRYPLYIAAADPEKNEPAKIGINGWETTDSPEGLYGAGNGKPVTYRFADIRSLEADGDLRTIEMAGYVDAGNYSMAFKGIENGLGWVAPPSSGSALLTMNHGAEPTVTVLGNSVETETLNNKVTLNIKGFTNGGGCNTTMSDMMTKDEQSANRSNHQVLTRYSDGSGTPALHWVPMGDKVQASGGAFKFYGNTGTSATTPVVVGSGSTTNAVRFATASDSNVKVDCASDGNGGVTITIGVYYK